MHSTCSLTLRLAQQKWQACQLLSYDPQVFTPAAFISAGITCPPVIRAAALVRQAEFFHGRLAAREALRALGRPDAEIAIGPGRQPVWPDGLVGSISHTRRWAAASVAEHRGAGAIGIDIEHVLSSADLDAVRAAAICPAEEEVLRTAAGPEHFTDAVTAAFSAKEAFFKAAYPAVLRHFGFDAVVVRGIDWEQRVVQLVVEAALAPPFMPGYRLDVFFEQVDARTLITSYGWGL